jgi:hypothetical protein
MPYGENRKISTGDAHQSDLKEKFNKAFEKNIIVAKGTREKKGGSKIAQIGILHILNEMKNPLTNIMLCLEMIESNHRENDEKDCHQIIRKSSKALEESIRDLIKSFNDLGISIHLEEDNSAV